MRSYKALQLGSHIIEFRPFVLSQWIDSTIFFVQESILSAIYMFQTWRLLKTCEVFGHKRTRQVLKSVICANAFVIVLDIIILYTAHAKGSNFPIWESYKGFAYSVKLKIEFIILNQLKKIVGGSTLRSDQVPTNSIGQNKLNDISSTETKLCTGKEANNDVIRVLGPV